jgi:hypothetical protein
MSHDDMRAAVNLAGLAPLLRQPKTLPKRIKKEGAAK